MNSEKAMTDAINYMVSLLKNGTDFVVSQAPEYIRQMIAYAIWLNHFAITISIILGVLLAIITIIISVKDEDSSCMVFNTFQLLFIIIIILSHITLKQIEIAPMLFVVEKLTALVK